MKLYMFRTVFLSIISSLFTVHSAMLCHTGLWTAFEQDQDIPARKLSISSPDKLLESNCQSQHIGQDVGDTAPVTNILV